MLEGFWESIVINESPYQVNEFFFPLGCAELFGRNCRAGLVRDDISEEILLRRKEASAGLVVEFIKNRVTIPRGAYALILDEYLQVGPHFRGGGSSAISNERLEPPIMESSRVSCSEIRNVNWIDKSPLVFNKGFVRDNSLGHGRTPKLKGKNGQSPRYIKQSCGKKSDGIIGSFFRDITGKGTVFGALATRGFILCLLAMACIGNSNRAISVFGCICGSCAFFTPFLLWFAIRF